MSISKIRSTLYFTAKILGDISAVAKGDIMGRIWRRITGKIAGRLLGKIR